MYPRLEHAGRLLRNALSSTWSFARVRRNGLAAMAAFSLLWGFAVWETVRAVDFGFNADEPRMIDSLAASARSGNLLPGSYNHPSLSHDLGLLVLAPKAVPIVREARDDAMTRPWEYGYEGVRKRVDVIRQALDTKLQPYVRSPAYLLRLRTAFAFLTMLAPIWTALAAWFWRRKVTDALVAGALVALSWEVTYHARWIAPDALLMMFAALTLACVGAADRSDKPSRWLYAATATAGLAFATRYSGALLFLLVIASIIRLALRREGDLRRRWPVAQAAGSIALFLGLFALLSPGVWIDPLRTLTDLTFEHWHYRHEGHGGHTVTSTWLHVWLILKWIGAASLSRYAPLAIAFSLLSVVGLVVLARREPLRIALWMVPPLAWSVWLAGTHVMIARDLLMVVPFIAVLSGVGVGWLHDLLRERGKLFVVVPLLTGGALFFNAYWAQASARSILERKTKDVGALTRTWVAEHPRVKIRPSRRVCGDLGGGCRPSMDRQDRGVCRAMFWMSELEPRAKWPSNTQHFELLGMGPFEVNLDHYATWTGDDRVVMLPCDKMDAFYKEAFEKIAEK